MLIDLSGKNAWVCGSTQGIGWECARLMAEAGANVTLIARDPEKLTVKVAELAHSPGRQHAWFSADFSEPEAMAEKAARQLEIQRAPVHILVNNTGGPPGGPLLDANTEALLLALRQHLISSQLLLQLLAPGMKTAGYGRIINVISTSVKQPIPGLGVSNTVRGAMANWAKTLSLELGPFGITVNNVLPGFTRTARLDAIVSREAEQQQLSEAEIAARMAANVPARRFAEPWEVAAAAVFLASPAASYVNGINLPVDGGRTASL